MVLTEPGLAGIVAAVKEGRTTFQRILSYTLNSITKKTVQVLFLAIGLFMTGHAILTPLLMVLTGDFLGMSLTTDNVRPSATPNVWQIGNLTIAGVVMGIGELLFCTAILCLWRLPYGISPQAHCRPWPFVVIVFGNQATTYTNRERRHLWSSLPQHLAPPFIRRRSPDRLDLGRGRRCHDAFASIDGGRHARRCHCLRHPDGSGEGTGLPAFRDHLGRSPSEKGMTMKISPKDFRVREGHDVDLKNGRR